MRYMWVGIFFVAMAGRGQVATANCESTYPYFWLKVCEHSNCAGDAIEYKLYVNTDADGEYELAVSDLGTWWDNTIESVDGWKTYPAHWWIYESTECGTLLEQGDGKKSSLAHKNEADSLRFRCPSDKDRTVFRFCENENTGGKCHSLNLFKHGKTNEVVIEVPELEGDWNDKISSIYTDKSGSTKHYYWYFYKDRQYNDGGAADLILKDTDQDRTELDTDNLNDQITSFRLVITDSTTAPTISGVPSLSEWGIPTLGEWGMFVLVLLVLTSGTVIIQHRRMMTNHAYPK